MVHMAGIHCTGTLAMLPVRIVEYSLAGESRATVSSGALLTRMGNARRNSMGAFGKAPKKQQG